MCLWFPPDMLMWDNLFQHQCINRSNMQDYFKHQHILSFMLNLLRNLLPWTVQHLIWIFPSIQQVFQKHLKVTKPRPKLCLGRGNLLNQLPIWKTLPRSNLLVKLTRRYHGQSTCMAPGKMSARLLRRNFWQQIWIIWIIWQRKDYLCHCVSLIWRFANCMEASFPPCTVYEIIISIQMFLEQSGIFWKLLDDQDSNFIWLKFTIDNVMKMLTSEGVGISTR